MNRSELENGTEENREVTELLAALPRVEAPANFDFGVKARIAAGGSKGRSALFPFLKVTVPVAVLLLIGTLGFYYGTTGSDSNAVARGGAEQNYAPAQAPITDPVVPSEQDTARESSERRVTQPVEDDIVAASTRTRKTGTPRRSSNATSKSEGGGSKDFGLTDATRNVILPRGINTNKNPEVSVRELLEMLGMKVDPATGKWTVLSTSLNSVAERAGVLANDVVDLIDDQPIGGKEKFKGSSGKSVTVNRGGKSIRLELKR